MEFYRIDNFFECIEKYFVTVYLNNGIGLNGMIKSFSLDEVIPYIILDPCSKEENDPFPYQFINLNNVGSIQRTKIKTYN